MGAAGNIACYGPVLAEKANVVIELLVIYEADYSGAQRNSTIFLFCKCSSHSSNITATNYDSFWSYDKHLYDMLQVGDKLFSDVCDFLHGYLGE